MSLLLAAYGEQGWWPLPSRSGKPGFDERGYHPGHHNWPRSRAERFEIVLGAALTQNTAWTNAEKALNQLRDAGIRLPADVLGRRQTTLATLIRSAGYFNQKARKLRALALFFKEHRSLDRPPAREELLSLWGVGPETADSILLYAFHVPTFVVDAYTIRFLTRAGLTSGAETYEDVRALFQRELPARHELFNEFHALIVAHCKRRCRKSPLCIGCPVARCPRVGVSGEREGVRGK